MPRNDSQKELFKALPRKRFQSSHEVMLPSLKELKGEKMDKQKENHLTHKSHEHKKNSFSENKLFITSVFAFLVLFSAMVFFFVYNPQTPTGQVVANTNVITNAAEVAAIVGDEKILMSDLDTRYATVPEELQAQVTKLSILENMVENTLVLQEARKNNIDATQAEIDEALSEQQAQVQALSEEGVITQEFLNKAVREFIIVNKYLADFVFKDLVVTEAKMQEYFNGNRDQIVQIKASHILVETEQEANELLEQIKNGVSFEDLAKEKSTDEGSAQLGGDLSFFSKADVVAEFGEAAFSMNVGDEPKIAQSQFGYHIIKVTEKKESFDDYKTQIESFLLQQEKDKAYSDFIEQQKAGKKIEILLKE